MSNIIGQVAFWEHDRFPYLLSGYIIKVDGDKIMPSSQTNGKYVTPKFILDPKEGHILQRRLTRLEEEYRIYRKVIERVTKSFDQEYAELIKDYEAGD